MINIWVVTSSTQLSLLTKELFYRILTEVFCQNIVHALLKKKLCGLNGRLDGKLEAFIGLPREEHACSCILAVVSRSILSALLPSSQILKKFHQELKPTEDFQNINIIIIYLSFICKSKKQQYQSAYSMARISIVSVEILQVGLNLIFKT